MQMRGYKVTKDSEVQQKRSFLSVYLLVYLEQNLLKRCLHTLVKDFGNEMFYGVFKIIRGTEYPNPDYIRISFNL